MTAIERLFKYIEFQNIKHTGLEKKIGISNGYLTKMLQNKASIGSDIMEKIVSYCENLSAEWLLTGKGSMIIENNPLFSYKENINEITVKEPNPIYESNKNSLELIEYLKQEIKEKDNKIEELIRENELLRHSIQLKE